MKGLVYTFIIFCMLIILCCNSGTFPYDDYDYSLDSLNIGIAFPPTGNQEELEFTQTHLEVLSMDRIRIGQAWKLREPENDNFYWVPLERRLDYFSSKGIEVFLTLDIKDFPDWMAGFSPSWRQVQFQEYVSILLTNYGNQIDYIQFGNEWNWEVESYLNADFGEFIAFSNILYSEVQSLPAGDRPMVSLGSIAIGGLRFIAIYQGKMDNVYFEGEAIYTEDEINEILANGDDANTILEEVLGQCNFDMIDIHLYDDYWNWDIYKQAYSDALLNTGKNPDDYIFIASEFGGPHPEIEGTDPYLQAERVVSYVHTLDEINIRDAYFFKLVESTGDNLPVHPNSYLIDASLKSNFAYEVMRRFGENNQ